MADALSLRPALDLTNPHLTRTQYRWMPGVLKWWQVNVAVQDGNVIWAFEVVDFGEAPHHHAFRSLSLVGDRSFFSLTPLPFSWNGLGVLWQVMRGLTEDDDDEDAALVPSTFSQAL